MQLLRRWLPAPVPVLAVFARGDGCCGKHQGDEEHQGPGRCQNTVQQEGDDGEQQAGPQDSDIGLPAELNLLGSEQGRGEADKE